MSPASATPHTCVWCQKPLQGKRRHATSCSSRCRVYAHRQRDKRAAPESVTPRDESVTPFPVDSSGTEKTSFTPALEASPLPSVGDATADLLLDALRSASPTGLTEDGLAARYGSQISATLRANALALLLRCRLATVTHEQTAGLIVRTVWRVM